MRRPARMPKSLRRHSYCRSPRGLRFLVLCVFAPLGDSTSVPSKRPTRQWRGAWSPPRAFEISREFFKGAGVNFKGADLSHFAVNRTSTSPPLAHLLTFRLPFWQNSPVFVLLLSCSFRPALASANSVISPSPRGAGDQSSPACNGSSAHRSLSNFCSFMGILPRSCAPKMCEVAHFRKSQFLENSPKLRELAEVARHWPSVAATSTCTIRLTQRVSNRLLGDWADSVGNFPHSPSPIVGEGRGGGEC